MHIHVILFGLLWLGACGYALLRGGTPERIMALCFVAGALLSPIVQHLEHGRSGAFHRIELGVLSIDTLMFAVTMWLALYSTRGWSFPMASMQATLPISHLANATAPQGVPNAYFAMAVFIALPQLALLGVATWRHRRRLSTIGIDFAWERDLPLAYLQGATLGELRRAGAFNKVNDDDEPDHRHVEHRERANAARRLHRR
jgi:hypothetical protein